MMGPPRPALSTNSRKIPDSLFSIFSIERIPNRLHASSPTEQCSVPVYVVWGPVVNVIALQSKHKHPTFFEKSARRAVEVTPAATLTQDSRP